MINFLKKLQEIEGVHIGQRPGSLFKTEVLTQKEMNHHVHIVGASGFGKSVLINHIIKHQISSGGGVVYIDLKGDRETLETFSSYARNSHRERDLEVFSLSPLSISSPINPLQDGSATQLRDKIMRSFCWSEEYYKNQAASFLLKVLTVLVHLRDLDRLALDFELLQRACSQHSEIDRISKLLYKDETKYRLLSEECFGFLKDNENFKSLQGLRSQIESLTLSDFSELLKCKTANSTDSGNSCAPPPAIDLFKTATESKINLFFLDTRRYGETARTIGKLLLQDLKSVSAKIDAEIPRNERKPLTVIIDEFSDLADEDFLAFLDRARSSRISVIIAHQELSDLQRISPEFAGRLMGNTSTLYAFLQKRPESAETIAGIAGTKSAWKTTKQTERVWLFDIETGGGSKRQVEEFYIHPNVIKSLGVGQCVCIKKYPESRSYLVGVSPTT